VFEGLSGREILLWGAGVLVAAAIVIFGAIWITDTFLDAGDPLIETGVTAKGQS
jgi:hypothetical protein